MNISIFPFFGELLEDISEWNDSVNKYTSYILVTFSSCLSGQNNFYISNSGSYECN